MNWQNWRGGRQDPLGLGNERTAQRVKYKAAESSPAPPSRSLALPAEVARVERRTLAAIFSIATKAHADAFCSTEKQKQADADAVMR